MKMHRGALLLAAVPLLAAAQPAPPTLSELAPLAPAASAAAPAEAASAPLKRRCVAGCDGRSARVHWSEDLLNRFEEHRDEAGRVVRLFVHPKNGLPRYEVLVAGGRSRLHQSSGSSALGGPSVTPLQAPQPQANQAVWELKKF